MKLSYRKYDWARGTVQECEREIDLVEMVATNAFLSHSVKKQIRKKTPRLTEPLRL